jgi:hypothetical protein
VTLVFLQPQRLIAVIVGGRLIEAAAFRFTGLDNGGYRLCTVEAAREDHGLKIIIPKGGAK